MEGRVVVLKAWRPDKERLHVYGCPIKELNEEDRDNKWINDMTVGFLMVVRNDFEYEQQLIHSDSDSYQIRTKALFKNTKGLFYKQDKQRIYLTDEEEQKVYKHIEYWKTLDWESINKERHRKRIGDC